MKQPLAFRLKPNCLDDIIGQKHLVGEKGIIRKCIKENAIFSMIFFGQPVLVKLVWQERLPTNLNVLIVLLMLQLAIRKI